MNSRLIYFTIFVLGLVLAFRLFYFYDSIYKIPLGKEITFQTKLSNQPKLKPNGQQVSVMLPNSQRVLVLFSFDPVLTYGDKVNIKGTVDYFEAENGNQVAYMKHPEFLLVKKGVESNPLLKMREKIITFFNSSLPQPYSSLMLGIVFGIKEEMPPSFYLDLQKTGLMHVIAASGMNITMVGGFLAGALLIFIRRQYALVLAIVGICIYAVLAGLEPSIVRAAIMGSLVFLAQITGRQTNAFLVLFIAAFAMLMRNPALIFDIGFQLSFLATFGLVYLRPIFELVPKIRTILSKSVIGEDFATTLTAQAMTLPILLINFGSYSFISIPVNTIVLWTVPFLMIIGGVSAIIGFLFEPVGRFILYISIPLLIYFTKVVEVFAEFPGQINLQNLPLIFIVGYYFILASLVWYMKNKK